MEWDFSLEFWKFSTILYRQCRNLPTTEMDVSLLERAGGWRNCLRLSIIHFSKLTSSKFLELRMNSEFNMIFGSHLICRFFANRQDSFASAAYNRWLSSIVYCTGPSYRPWAICRKETHNIQCLFIGGHFNGAIDSLSLLSRINIYALSLQIPRLRSSAGRSNPVIRMPAKSNASSDAIDFAIYSELFKYTASASFFDRKNAMCAHANLTA